MQICPYTNSVGLKQWVLVLILPLLLSENSFAQDSKNATISFKGDGIGFQLSIVNNLITLDAKHISLKRILEAIGQELRIEFSISTPEEKKVTIQFENRSLEEALKLFKVNYALVSNLKDRGGPIKRIIIVPAGQQAEVDKILSVGLNREAKTELKVENESASAPFKFQFDPSKVIDQSK